MQVVDSWKHRPKPKITEDAVIVIIFDSSRKYWGKRYNPKLQNKKERRRRAMEAD